MHLQRLLIYLSFVVLANASNPVKKEIKEPNVLLDTVRIIQQPKKPAVIAASEPVAAALTAPAPLDSSFMPVFLTTSNVKASDFTQEMLKSLATNSYVKPSVKLSNKSNSPSKSSNSAASSRSAARKSDATVKSETVSTRWSKAGSTSNFSPALPISLSKMHFDTTGFIPIIPKQAVRSSSNAKLIKQASKPISKQPTVNAKSIPLPKQVAAITSAKRKNLVIDLSSLSKESLPNPSVRALKSIKSNIKSTNAKQPTTGSSAKPNAAAKSASRRPSSSGKPAAKNAKIVDNRPIAASSSTELNSYLSSQLSSRDARKALLQMNTLRYLAKLSPQWSASSLSETYQPTQTKIAGGLSAYPIGKITIPASDDGYGSGGQKKPEISIELIKEILHKLTNDEVQFNKLYVMGTHRYKPKSNEQEYGNNQADYGSDNAGGYQQDNAGGGGGYQSENEGYQNNYQQDQGGSYQENNGGGDAGYAQPEGGGYAQPEGGYNQPDNGGYSQPDYSQDQGGNSYQGGNYENGGGDGNSYTSNGPADSPYPNDGGGNSYSNEGNSYGSNDGGNSYGSNEGNSYGSNEGSAYNTDNGNSYQGGGDSDQEQGYHLQSLGYDMSQYDNRAYVPAYSLHSLASFVHSKFKETAYKKQMGEYEYKDNPFMNNYENYKSMDVNYAQYVPDQPNNGMGGGGMPAMGGGRKKCSKNHNNGGGGGGGSGGYANNDVNFDDSYNNYVVKIVHPGVNINDFK